MPTKPMTKIQRETWRWIIAYRTRNGYSPTYQEIQTRFKLASTNSVFARLAGLELGGWLKRDPILHQRNLIPVEKANPKTTTKKGAKSANRNHRNPGDPT